MPRVDKSVDIYPYKFEPIYKEKIWGGRNLERLFRRPLPPGKKIGESWELADLKEGTSVVANGPAAGKTLTDLTAELGEKLLGGAEPTSGGRFPLLLKFLDANDILSLQVHPDAQAAAKIGGDAAPKTECWYVVESRGGYIYKGLKGGVAADQLREAIQSDTVESLVRRYDVAAGDFHYLPAGTVHAIGPGVVVAEVQTPSDTTYRVTDWGRPREIQVERSMQCIHFEPPCDKPPGAVSNRLLATDDFSVCLCAENRGEPAGPPEGSCAALMVLSGRGRIQHKGRRETAVSFHGGETILLAAALEGAVLIPESPCTYLEIKLPMRSRLP